MRIASAILVLLLASVAHGQTALLSGNIDGAANKLVEIHTTPKPPEGFTVLGQEWLVLDDLVDWRQYDNGSVFVATAPPGTYQARWRCQYLRIEPTIEGKTEWRVYTITIRGPPGPVEPDPTKPLPPGPRLVAIVYESSTTALPTVIHPAIAKLRQQGLQVRVIDRDATTGTGQVPEELAPLLEAAKGRSGVSLVVSAGGSVRVAELPATESAIIAEATK